MVTIVLSLFRYDSSHNSACNLNCYMLSQHVTVVT